jgi:hypothetical protein
MGKFTYADESVYEGGWVDDEKVGQGVYRWSDGSRLEGVWESGMPKQGILVERDGS